MKKHLSILLIASFISVIFYFLYFSIAVKIHSGAFPSYKGVLIMFIFILLFAISGEAIIGAPLFLLVQRKKILNFLSFVSIGGLVGALPCGLYIMISKVEISKILILITAVSVLSSHVIVWIFWKNKLTPICGWLTATPDLGRLDKRI